MNTQIELQYRQGDDLIPGLCDTFNITEDDIDAKAHGDTVDNAKCPDVLLGQVIHGVLYELSFHGGPEQQVEFHDELNRDCAAVTGSNKHDALSWVEGVAGARVSVGVNKGRHHWPFRILAGPCGAIAIHCAHEDRDHSLRACRARVSGRSRVGSGQG